LTLAGHRCPPKLLYHFSSSSGQGKKKYNKKLVGQEKDGERLFTNYCHGQKRLDLWKKLI